MREPKSSRLGVVLALAAAGAVASALAGSSDARFAASSLVRVVIAAGALAIVVRRRLRIGYPLAVGLAFTVVGDVLYQYVVPADSTTSFADVLYLVYYPCVALAIAALVRRYRVEAVREALLDASACALAVLVLVWQFLIAGEGIAQGSISDRVVNAAYPLGDVLLAGMVVLLILATKRSLRGGSLLAVHVVLTFAADMLFTTFGYGGATWRFVTVPIFTFSYGVLLAVLACWDRPLEPRVALRPQAVTVLHPARMAMLTFTMTVAPVAAMIEVRRGGDIALPVVIGSSLVLPMLVSMRMKGLVEQAQRAESDLAYRASHDVLTALPNRQMLAEHLGRVLAREAAGDHGIGALFVDLDRFKLVNDHLGHRAGDELLNDAAARLRSVVRADDLVARLGGDEFVVICDHLPEHELVMVASRIVEVLSAPFDTSAGQAHVAASVGVAHSPDRRASSEQLLNDADTAMYQAKASGGNRWALFSEGLKAQLTERLLTEKALRDALERDEVVIEYQPQVALPSHEIVGFEALVRLPLLDGSLMSPLSFIPVAEETGLIVPLGCRVLEQACAQLARWNDARADRAPFTMSVNVSPRQLSDRDYVASVERALAATGIDPSWLTLEITETALAHDQARVQARLDHMRAMGIRIAVDDFGTGFSSLASLRKYPLDEVKIDRAFVSELGDLAPDRTIASAVIALARCLGYRTVAEGVELEQQADALETLGCDVAQGFLYARPLSVGQVDRLLAGADGAALVRTARRS